MKCIGLILALGAALLLPRLAHADAGAPDQGARQPSAPQGVLHLRSHTVSVTINNGFATTRVDQVLVKTFAKLKRPSKVCHRLSASRFKRESHKIESSSV